MRGVRAGRISASQGWAAARSWASHSLMRSMACENLAATVMSAATCPAHARQEPRDATPLAAHGPCGMAHGVRGLHREARMGSATLVPPPPSLSPHTAGSGTRGATQAPALCFCHTTFAHSADKTHASPEGPLASCGCIHRCSLASCIPIQLSRALFTQRFPCPAPLTTLGSLVLTEPGFGAALVRRQGRGT